jgi:hypothetical protein
MPPDLGVHDLESSAGRREARDGFVACDGHGWKPYEGWEGGEGGSAPNVTSFTECGPAFAVAASGRGNAAEFWHARGLSWPVKVLRR